MTAETSGSGWLLAMVGAAGLVLGAAITGGFNYLSHRGDLDSKMIELSVGILRAQPTLETSPLREWAIDVIQKRANFSFSPSQRAALLKKELPFIPYTRGVDVERMLERMEKGTF